jgi:hypothetical protein
MISSSSAIFFNRSICSGVSCISDQRFNSTPVVPGAFILIRKTSIIFMNTGHSESVEAPGVFSTLRTMEDTSRISRKMIAPNVNGVAILNGATTPKSKAPPAMIAKESNTIPRNV